MTASSFGSICKATENMDKKKKCQELYLPKKLSTAAVIYGKTHEPVAARKFQEIYGRSVLPTGLFIHPEHNYLAGIVALIFGFIGMKLNRLTYQF